MGIPAVSGRGPAVGVGKEQVEEDQFDPAGSEGVLRLLDAACNPHLTVGAGEFVFEEAGEEGVVVDDEDHGAGPGSGGPGEHRQQGGHP